jgi:hypothetical protein
MTCIAAQVAKAFLSHFFAMMHLLKRILYKKGVPGNPLLLWTGEYRDGDFTARHLFSSIQVGVVQWNLGS